MLVNVVVKSNTGTQAEDVPKADAAIVEKVSYLDVCSR